MTPTTQDGLAEQYRDDRNLNARLALHQRFSGNQYGWQPWLFDQLGFPSQARILEVGCGPGDLWRRNAARIPAGWRLLLTDLSAGMVAAAQRNLADLVGVMAFGVADAQDLPFCSASFDAAIANHMLYHVPDRPRALAELARVLRPGGCLVAATNGERNMAELGALVRGFDPDIRWEQYAAGFTLQNGAAQLAPWFGRVERLVYEDGLVITEAEPLVAYVLSMQGNATQRLSGDQASAFADYVQRTLARDGAIRIGKEAGLFRAWRN